MKSRKSWHEKLVGAKGLPKVVVIKGKLRKSWGKGTCAIPAPIEVDELMRQVPKGRITTINDIRAAVAKRHGATIGCPITSGIFAMIAAHAAEEDAAGGRKNVTPYWRTLKSGGVLNEKYPGGAAAQKAKLEQEGHKVLKMKKNYSVENYEQAVFQPR